MVDMSDAVGPQQQFSQALHGLKYRLPSESFREMCGRVASSLKDDDDHYHEFRAILLGMRFLPAGRVQAAMGAPKIVTPYNCFVSGTIADSFTEGDGSIMQRALQAAETLRMGGGIGYDFSTLRPRGELIRKLQSKSSGPVSFMGIYDAVCQCVAASGHRRGAQMGVMRVDHPDVEEFVRAKQDINRLTGFNLSLAVTDEFMEAVSTGRPFMTRWGGRNYGEIDAAQLWETIMRGTWDFGEPGVLFIDTINRMNNLYYCENIAATNPCGEQPLPPFGACLLGSFNLVKYLSGSVDAGYTFDINQFREDVPVVVRAMDNIVDRATYPLMEQRMEAMSKRRMGLGVTALANTAEALGYPYGSEGFIQFQLTVLEELREAAYIASSELAREKGSFPKFDRDLFLAGRFTRTLSDRARRAIYDNGIRNSHLVSIAPTGTISMCADNVSSGIEPVYAYSTHRLVFMEMEQRAVDITDYGIRELGVAGVLSKDVTAAQHIDVLAAASNMVDSAVSKTCNMDGSMPWEEFKELYTDAWSRGCKGCTTFNSDGKRAGILLNKEDPEVEAATSCTIDQNTGRRDCS